MSVSKIWLFAPLLLLKAVVGPETALGQTSGEVISLPVQFGQYYSAWSLINPAQAGSSNKLELNAGNLRQSGNFSGITTYYGTGSYRMNKYTDSVAGNKHIIGAKLVADYEGTYLSRTRVYGLYAFHTPLSNTVWASAGTTMGLMNYAVQGSNLSGNGSATNIDGDIGFWLHSDVFNAGFALNQVFNSKLQPFQEVTRLRRHYTANASCTLSAGPFTELRPGLMLRWLNKKQYDLDITTLAVFDELITTGVSFRVRKSINFVAGLEKFRLGENGFMRLLAGYNIPLAIPGLLNTNQYEITLTYSIP